MHVGQVQVLRITVALHDALREGRVSEWRRVERDVFQNAQIVADPAVTSLLQRVARNRRRAPQAAGSGPAVNKPEAKIVVTPLC